MPRYQVFARNWWKEERTPNTFGKGYTTKLVPDARARKTNLAVVDSYEKAVEFCREWNNSHNPGKLSRKAEFTSI